ncbi:aminopeptidase-P [Pluteus cervinus]|uniref:Aminopeptidase-P n=1 Tax=Pluteus cervinus TaxID=181527 RepID=A0ACD3AG32_9AGAR|nr:aminopeptidase-P [Pluteus cervinus]
MAPPPPPPPICLPFLSSKPKRRLSWTSSEFSHDTRREQLIRRPSYSASSTMGSSADNLTFVTDTEQYEDIPASDYYPDGKRGGLKRGNTMTGTKKSTVSSKWGYGWGIGKQKGKEIEAELDMAQHSRDGSAFSKDLPLYQPPQRSNSQSTQASKMSSNSKRSARTQESARTQDTQDTERTKTSHHSQGSQHSHQSQQSQQSYQSGGTNGEPPKHIPPPRSQHQRVSNDSASTLIGSALERKLNDVDSYKGKIDTGERLEELRKLMRSHSLDYYVIPTEDAHQSEYVGDSDKRREFISGFTGSSGQAIVTMQSAYLVTDSRYWLQAKEQLDPNWHLVSAGSVGGPKDWIEWLSDRAKGVKIGLDARMISYEKATTLKSKIEPHGSKLHYPPQNLVDLVWKDKPPKSKSTIFTQSVEYAGRDIKYKISKLREWLQDQPPSVVAYSKGTPQVQAGVLITALDEIAYMLNLRGSDIPYNPLFHAYLYVGLDRTIVFVDKVKIMDDVAEYLRSFDIEQREYMDVWPFLRKREWGEGKVRSLISLTKHFLTSWGLKVVLSPSSPYAVALMLTHFRVTILPSHVETMLSVKNETEIDGLRRAYMRDAVAFVRFLAWLEGKLNDGYDITEYEAGLRITEYRRKHRFFQGLAYKNISASGPNAALPHYQPRKATALMIDRNKPYLMDSGGQWIDGTCDTTRTLLFGINPKEDYCEAYTRVLQGHIAIDTAIFPEGTSGEQLDVLARKALWKDGLNYMHGTGHGFGSFLTVHEGQHSFSSRVPLKQGNVITNEPGYYAEGNFGMRIESALLVKRVKTKHSFNGNIWLGFERLTCVPIQTKLIKENMLTKEEKQWIKDHNQKCYERLAPLLKEDKRALKWLEKEAKPRIGIAKAGGIPIEWD